MKTQKKETTVNAASIVDQPILDLDGTAHPELTIGKAIVAALINVYPDEQSVSGEEKMRRFVLAQRIALGTDIDLTAEDTALAKKMVAKCYGTLVVGRVWAVLDPASAR
ncbi:hypothetical protein [Methylobacterium fujisawaense]